MYTLPDRSLIQSEIQYFLRQIHQDLAVMSQIFSVIFYIKVPVEKHTIFFFFFFTFRFYYFLTSVKIHINLIKYIKAFEPYYKIEVSKLHQLKRKLGMECVLYIEIRKKIPYNIVRKIDIKNVTSFF